MLRRFTVVLSCCLLFAFCATAEEVKPIKVLLLCGGCCHDYAKQKDILKKGIEERANATVEIIYAPGNSEKPPLPIYGKPDYATGYDVVIHDECAAKVQDPEVIAGVLKPHKDGIPAVNLHCAMHCYRFGDFGKPVAAGAPNAAWYEYLGLHSTGHGPQVPISVTYKDKEHPITKGLEDWITIKEEHYNNIKVYPSAHVLAEGKQTVNAKDNVAVNVWTNEYGEKKTRVFSTTIGHNNETVSDPRYLDLVTRGMLWSVDKLNDKYLKKK